MKVLIFLCSFIFLVIGGILLLSFIIAIFNSLILHFMKKMGIKFHFIDYRD